MFILSVDLFPHTSKGPIFTALPGFGRFSRQKMDFPHFREEGNPSNFHDFWLFSAIFATKQHHRLNMRNMDAKNRSTNTRYSVKGTYLLYSKHDCETGKMVHLTRIRE